MYLCFPSNPHGALANINYLIKTNLSIENISDLHYRTYSSGISAPGRNINFGINIKF